MIKQNVGDGLAHPAGLARPEQYYQNLSDICELRKHFRRFKHSMDKASLVPTYILFSYVRDKLTHPQCFYVIGRLIFYNHLTSTRPIYFELKIIKKIAVGD